MTAFTILPPPEAFGPTLKHLGAHAAAPDSIPPYRSPEWMKWRRGFIGGSDIPIIMGASFFKTPYDLWCEKVGRVPIDDETSEAAEWGLELEPIILRRLEAALRPRHPEVTTTLWGPATIGAQVQVGELFVPAIASLDGVLALQREGAQAELRVLESKLTGSKSFRGTMRDSDYWQVLWALMLTGWSKGHIGLLHNGTKLYPFDVERHPQDEMAVAEAVAEFWNCVQTDTPPEGYAREAASEAVIQDADPILSMEIERLYEIDRLADELEMEADSIKATIEELASQRGAKGFISAITSRKVQLKHSPGKTTTDWKKVVAEAGVKKDIIDRNTKRGNPYTSITLDKAKG